MKTTRFVLLAVLVCLLATGFARADWRPTVVIPKLQVAPLSFDGILDEDVWLNAARHLIEQGHSRLLYASGVSLEAAMTVRERFAGYAAALNESGQEARWQLVDRRPEILRQLVRSWLAEGVTGIVCENDYLALTVHSACSEEGIAVPGDLSLIGFDNLPQTMAREFSLTTVEQPFYEMGKQAAQLLVQALAGALSNVPGQVCLPVKLILRGSVQALTNGDRPAINA